MRKLIATHIIECPACDGKRYIVCALQFDVLGEEPQHEKCFKCDGRGKVLEYTEIETLDGER